ncbi:hypothetical protein Bbelb_270770 [Branchiostoma belcheri]|nr:hypothetical protein Bbelb_270770 [Branchiostoma belcheri]
MSYDNATPVDTYVDLQTTVDLFDGAYSHFGLTSNTGKTKILAQGAPGDHAPDTSTVRLHGEVLETLSSSDSSMRKDIDNRIRAAHAAFWRISKRVFLNHDLNLQTKISVFRAIVLSTLLYGSELWVLYRRDIKRLESFQQQKLRVIMKIKRQDCVSNEAVLFRAYLPSIETTVAVHRLRRVGHVSRMPETRLPRQILFSQLESGTRPRGAPRRRFRDQLKDTLLRCAIDQDSWEHLAEDRTKWRRTVMQGTAYMEDQRRAEAEAKRQQRKERLLRPRPPPTLPCRKSDAVGLWPLNSQCGASDKTGNGNDGVARGTQLAPGPNGDPDGAFLFSGTANSYIDIPNNGKLDVRYSYTILAHIYPTGQAGPIFNYVGNNNQWAVHLWQTGSHDLFMRTVGRYGYFPNAVDAPNVLQQNAWNYVGGTYNSSTGVAILWNNGQAVAQVQVRVPSVATQYPVRVAVKDGDRRYFTGRIACIQLYNYAMTQEQIVAARETCFRRVCAQTYPLGMESGAIPDDNITASSNHGGAYEPYHGRLNGVAGVGAWSARRNTIGEWLQVDLGEKKTVAGTIIQGRYHAPYQWVTSYKLQYSVDGLSWITYASSEGPEEVFPGNTDRNTPVTNLLDSPTDARYVRFLPQSWHGHISMRVEVLGCSVKATGHRTADGHSLHYRASQTAGTTFNFTVQASSPGRSSIQASQVVVFQDNRACGLAIRCINNCDWSNTNPSEDLVLEAVPGSNDTPLYEWSVVEHPSGFPGLQMTSTEPEVIIASNTFHVSGRYILRVVNRNRVCRDGLAVSEWTFTVWGPPALRIKTLSTPCVIERAGVGGCVCCGEFVDGPGHIDVTYKFRHITSSVDVEKGWVQFPQHVPFLQAPLPPPYLSKDFIIELEVISIDGRVAAFNITEATGEDILDLDGLSRIQLTDVNDVIELSSFLVLNTAELDKFSKNETLLIVRSLELSAETLQMLVEKDSTGSIPVYDINIASVNIFTGFAILLESVATSAWDAEGSDLQETAEVNRKTASTAFKSISNVLNMYYTLMPVNESASLEMTSLHAKVLKEPCQVSKKKFTVNDTVFVVPAFSTIGKSSEGADSFGVEIINSDFNPFRYSENSPDVGSEVAGLTVWQERDGRPVHHLPEPVDMIIPRDKQRTTSTVFKYTGRVRSSDGILRTRTTLTIFLNINSTSQPDLDMPRMQLVLQRASQPTVDSFNTAKWTAVLPVPQDQLYTLQLQHTYNNTILTSNPYSWLLPPEALHVTELDIQDETPFFLGVKYDGEDTSVTVSILESACVYFGEDSSHLWEHDGCEVGPLSNITHLHCRCDHLTKFTGFVPPNPIDFTPSGNFFENPIGLIAVLTVFGLFLLGYLMARKADRLDLTKVGVTTPTSHTLNPDPDCRYVITVYTGFRLDAGTTAQVSITVFGFRDESHRLALQDARRQLFQGGSVDSFLVSCENPLGPLTHIHVWHDNTGPSPAWYLSKVVIQHLSSGQLDYFICNKWLALDEDDGKIDRMVFVASPEEMAALSNLITERAAKDFHDGHLFFSVVGRPARSTFTRTQRLSCCLSTVYSTMLANIMFFGQGDNFDPPQPVRIMGVEIDPPISLPQLIANS